MNCNGWHMGKERGRGGSIEPSLNSPSSGTPNTSNYQLTHVFLHAAAKKRLQRTENFSQTTTNFFKRFLAYLINPPGKKTHVLVFLNSSLFGQIECLKFDVFSAVTFFWVLLFSLFCLRPVKIFPIRHSFSSHHWLVPLHLSCMFRRSTFPIRKPERHFLSISLISELILNLRSWWRWDSSAGLMEFTALDSVDGADYSVH